MGLKKFVDWEGNDLDVYKVKDASDVGVGLTRHEWQGERTATKVGTTITANIMNELQKGLVHSLETTKKIELGKEIYEIDLNGIDEFGLFESLKLLLEIKSGNQTNNVFIRMKNKEYQIQKNQGGTLENLEAYPSKIPAGVSSPSSWAFRYTMPVALCRIAMSFTFLQVCENPRSIRGFIHRFDNVVHLRGQPGRIVHAPAQISGEFPLESGAVHTL